MRTACGLVFYFCLLFSEAFADEHLPTLSLQLYFVDELAACRPDGYAPGDASTQSECERLTIRYIENNFEGVVPSQREVNIPPGTLFLDNNFRLPIELYASGLRQTNYPDPSDRKSVIFIFEWPEPHNFPFVLTRHQAESVSPTFRLSPKPPYRGEGQNHRRFIYHERAETFDPAYRVYWTLQLLAPNCDDADCTWTIRGDR